MGSSLGNNITMQICSIALMTRSVTGHSKVVPDVSHQWHSFTPLICCEFLLDALPLLAQGPLSAQSSDRNVADAEDHAH